MARDSNKHASIQTKDGVLIVKDKFVRVPYSLLRSGTYIALSPLATKIYNILISRWYQHKYTEKVQISLDELQQLCPSRYKKKDKVGTLKPGRSGRNQIIRAIGELVTGGFINSSNIRGAVGKYEIIIDWYTGRRE